MEKQLSELNLKAIRRNVCAVVADHKGEWANDVVGSAESASICQMVRREGGNTNGGRQMMPREISGPQF